MAYKVYKELERQLNVKQADLSCEQAIDIAKTIYAVEITDSVTGKIYTETLLLNGEQKRLADLFGF